MHFHASTIVTLLLAAAHCVSGFKLPETDTSVIEERDVERPASPAALIGAVSPPEDE